MILLASRIIFYLMHKQRLTIVLSTEEKARKELAAKAGGKGPLNTGGQGIKKSGKK